MTFVFSMKHSDAAEECCRLENPLHPKLIVEKAQVTYFIDLSSQHLSLQQINKFFSKSRPWFKFLR